MITFSDSLSNSEIENVYGFKVAAYDRTKELVIDPLLASTLLGGLVSDSAGTIAIDSVGNVVIAGQASSSDFPVTKGAYDMSHNGNQDVFVSKLSGDLTRLLSSTFLGGSGDEWAHSITIDTVGNVFVAGETASSNFPITLGAYDISFVGSRDGFVSRLNGDLTSLLASTFLGGSDYDAAHSVEVVSEGNVLVAGYSFLRTFLLLRGLMIRLRMVLKMPLYQNLMGI